MDAWKFIFITVVLSIIIGLLGCILNKLNDIYKVLNERISAD